MVKSIKCPICGKDGVHDFYTEDVVCPCCGSDLSVYHKLYGLSSANVENNVAAKRNRWVVPVLVVSTVWFVASCLFFAFRNSQIPSAISEQTNELQSIVNQLNDSIIALNNEIVLLRAVHSKPSQNSNLVDELRIYVIKKGDSFCRISKKLYGTEIRYKEIVKLNNLNARFLLHEGDSLKVPVK